ncbi:MAG TPA: alpha/beta fold hydrolase, partial [Longimicrobium sp.]|nr:alpha/beta fold hydrolase [Longimicrobium sp.]
MLTGKHILRIAATALLAAPAPAFAQNAAPDTSAERIPAGVTERLITLGSGEWAVTGVLTLPAGDGPFPAAVLMHGSGPGTRDLDVGPNKVFREEAWGLAAHGVAVLRYDKRSTAHAARFRTLGREATHDEEFMEEGVSAVRLLQATRGVDPRRVYLVGHSQSTLLAPTIARRTGAAGVVLIAPSARPAWVLIREQVEYSLTVAPNDTALARRARVMLDGVAQMEDPATPPTALVLGRPVSYWRISPERNREELRAMLAEGGRALVVHGGRDYLVTDTDFAIWQREFGNQPGIELRRYADLNHLM